MKKTIYIAVLMILSAVYSMAQQTASSTPPTFEQFFKHKVKTFPGAFPVYQVDDKYYLEIEESRFNKDILVIGDLKNGPSVMAKSSGIISFSKGLNQNLNVSRNNYSERATNNAGMSELLKKSTMAPVSFVFHIEALGRKKGSYIIDISRQLIDGGDLFSFQNFNGISSPDPSRSGVEGVKPVADGVVFSVIRSQNSPGQDDDGRMGDRAFTYQLDLVIQQLGNALMPVKFSDQRIGFATQSYTEFGQAGYTAKKVNIIKKWNLKVKAEDVEKYKKGILVEPQRPIMVFIDRATPGLFVNAVKEGILQWNRSFEAAGFKNAIQIAAAETDGNAWMSAGKLLVSWGGNLEKISTTMLDDPRSGEILAAKMSISEEIADALLPKYFVQCGAYDTRVQQNLFHPGVRAEILKFKVGQAMAELLGLLPNYAASAAYRPKQISDPKWVMKHGFTSSITDDQDFNFMMKPGSLREPKLFIPSVSSYDDLAINWAYRVYQDEKTTFPFLKGSAINPEYYYAPESKINPVTQHRDLSSDLLDAATTGIDALRIFYPQLKGITDKMKDDTWDTYMLLAANFPMSYDQYVCSVLPNLGGRISTVVLKNYNEVPYVYVDRATQQRTFDFLNQYLLSRVPEWMKNDLAQSVDGSNTETITMKTVVKVLKAFADPEMISSLVQAENSGRKNVFSSKDLFDNIDHYVFKDFDPKVATNSYSRAIQAGMIMNLVEMASKNKIGGGLTDVNVVINSYMESIISRVNEMSTKHTDPMTREHYKLMKIQINNEYTKK